MADVYTRRIARVRQGPANITVTLFVAPAGGTVVIRDVLVSNVGATAGYVQLALKSAGSSVAMYIHNAVAVGRSEHLETRQAMAPGEELVLTTNGSEMAVVVTGYFLG